MKTIKYAGLFLFTAIVLSSCQKVVQVDVPEGETLLVVDAWINDLPGTQTVRLTTTVPVFDPNRTPTANGATVILTDLSNGKQYTFNQNIGTGNYEFTPATGDTLAVETHQYQLSIAWQGNSYSALSTLNRTTTIDTVGYDQVKDFASGELEGYAVWLFGKDIPGPKRDYYWIKSYRNGVLYNQSNVINISEDAGGGESTDGLCFIPPVAYFTVLPFDKPLQVNDTYTAEVHSLNKESYEYLYQMYTQINNSQAGLFATTPENLRTNIKPVGNAPRAVGWFNMAKVSSKSFSVQDYSYETVFPFYYCP
ncbi:MAG: hypothetical protein K0S33_1214 [Bacteroidetes bacterium]|nr:hypothetical protein [Bacteroidota bacterium]